MSFSNVFVILTFIYVKVYGARFYEERLSHQAYELTSDEIQLISGLTNLTHMEATLDKILVPRVVGSEGHKEVGDFIIKELEDLGMTVEIDQFKERTPNMGVLTFKNIVARLNPNARRFLVLACHYDSKYFRTGTFVGAVDSAVPCTMMLNIVKVMKPYLDKIQRRNKLSLELIFFDGEEAFQEWGPTDSIYGARHLAEKREEALLSFRRGEKQIQVNELEQMDVLVLLDLLGAPDPAFYSYFQDTERWFVRMMEAEIRLSEQGLLQNYSNGKPRQRYFQPRSSNARIEDDHLPFLEKDQATHISKMDPDFAHVWTKIASLLTRVKSLPTGCESPLERFCADRSSGDSHPVGNDFTLVSKDAIFVQTRAKSGSIFDICVAWSVLYKVNANVHGVPIVHLIAHPFPKEWHTAADNRSAVDMTTTENLCKILRVFIAEYLKLPMHADRD